MTHDPWFRETFEKAKAHLLAQGVRATFLDNEAFLVVPTTASGSCRYRVPGTDLKCAVGCLVPNDVYSPDIEGGGVYDLPMNVLNALGVSGRDDKRMGFLARLQRIHDNIDPHRWAQALDEFESDMKAEGLL